MGRARASLLLGAVVLAMAGAARLGAAAGLGVGTEAGPSDMVGRWTGAVTDGPRKGQPAADMEVALTPEGPDVRLTLYRYRIEGDAPPEVERPPVVRHGVKDGVLSFRTRVQDFRLGKHDPPSVMEGDWEFSVVGKDRGELRFVRNSLLEARKAQGHDVPPPPPPLAMKRVARP